MTGLEKRKKKAIDGASKFFDWVEWTGHLPGMHSEDRLEKKLAYWMIHLKQAKKGTGSCTWYQELGDIAAKHHLPDLFDIDTRVLNYYESFSGMQIGPYKVNKLIRKSLSPPVKSKINPSDRFGLSDSDDDEVEAPEYYRITDNFISYWSCTNEKGEEEEVSAFTLIRALENPDYIKTVSQNIAIKDIVSHSVGPWFLLGFIGFHGDKNETCWLCKRTNDSLGEIERVILPPLKQLLRFVRKSDGRSVDPVIDSVVGHGVDDMTGRKCQYWTAVGFSHKAVNNECMWYCMCDCGRMKVIAGGKLRNGNSKSCGCYRNEVLAQVRLEKKKEELEKEMQELVQVST